MVMYLKADIYIKYKTWMKMGFAHSWLECKKQANEENMFHKSLHQG